ncbi:Vacuolar protein sorting-associated protein 11 [Tilletia horrida]|uniref:Vacuolar protein sorting-associated protein 11 n=1 Tax=Tilletia horrida TaxID=155126 RepID=A0AAN6G7X5_9BASI|nr:Vacuolar protein sorting-associated protein 11 [Tilletia horrida]
MAPSSAAAAAGGVGGASAVAAAAAAAPAWRQFTFFDVSTVRDHADFARSPVAFRRKSTNEIAAITTSIVRPPGLSASSARPDAQTSTSAPCVLLADIGGTVTLLDPLNAYSELASFDAFGPSGRITHLSTDAHGRILTLGEVDTIRFPLLRIWDIRTPPTILPPRIDIADASQNKTSTSSVTDPAPPQIRWRPRLLGEARVQHGSRPLPIAAMSHTPSLSYLAIALADGTVLLMRNVDSALLGAGGATASSVNMNASTSQAAASIAPIPAVTLPKFKVVCSPDTSHSDKSAANMSMSLDPVTALGFSESGVQTIAPAAPDLGSAGPGQGDLRAGPEPRRRNRRGRGGLRTGTMQSRTGIGAANDPPPRVITGPTTVHLFITTLSRTLRYTVLGAGAGASPAIVDDVGCALGCAALVAPPSIPVTSGGSFGGGSGSLNLGTSTVLGGSGAGGPSGGAKMVLAREEAVYVVGAEGREAAYANEGPKSFVRLHPSSQQLIIVSPPFTPTAASHSATVRHYVAQRDRPSPLSSSPTVGSPPSRTDSPTAFAKRGGHHASGQPAEIAKVTVFDLDNRFVAYTGTFEGGIRDVWIEPYAPPAAVAAASSSTSGATSAPGKVGSSTNGSAAADDAAVGLMGLGGDIIILGDDGSLTRLTEKPLRDKLAILFRKYLFLLAVGLSKTHAARASAAAYSRALASYSASQQVASLPKGMDRAGAAIAVAFAAAQEVAARIEPLLGDIYRRYGDHLYDKGDFYGSVAQYVKTVGWVQPSYIIRKFLDAQRIQHLTTYLEALHAGGLANSDHTTLLLNCYTKLKDVKSLDRFIKHPPNLHRSDEDEEDDFNVSQLRDGGAATADDLPFDLDTAIRVCRQAGYFGHAAYLAERYEQHDEYLRIQIEDGKGYGEALDYLRRLDAEEAERHLARYARILLSELPERTTDLLIEICSGTFRKAPKIDVDTAANGAGKETRPTATGYLSLLQYGKSGTTSSNGRKQSIASTDTNAVKSGAASAVTMDPSNFDLGEENFGEAPPYLLPSPRPFFAHFIQHQRQFIRFLETVALRRWGQSVTLDFASLEPEKAAAVRDLRERQRERIAAGLDEDDPDTKDQRAVWNTLLELYLSSAAARKSAPGAPGAGIAAPSGQQGANSMTIKALSVLKQYEYLPYDDTQAVLLCSIHEFIEGLFFLYERMGMYEDILRYWMDLEARTLKSAAASDEADATSASPTSTSGRNVMDCLSTYGGAHPHLYPLVLRWLVSDERVLARHRDDFAEVLDHIEHEDLMGPLEVVKALSKSKVANLGLIREYLLRAITQEREDIDADRRLTESYRDETAKKLSELAELSNPQTAHVFQTTKCSACGGQLDLPTVHFLCKHSYHQRCLGETETECPTCARGYGVIRDIRRNNEAFADRHDIFMAEVEDANDGFGAVANMFSKGLFGANLIGAAVP